MPPILIVPCALLVGVLVAVLIARAFAAINRQARADAERALRDALRHPGGNGNGGRR